MMYYINPREMTFRNMMRHWVDSRQLPQSCVSVGYVPLGVDLVEEQDAYVLKAFVPGIKPEELDIQITGDTITIRGEYKSDGDEKQEKLLSELPEGSFDRVLTMPVGLQSEKAEAQVENGVLTLRIPKAEEARPKTIKVESKEKK